jgi:hypothetical protein
VCGMPIDKEKNGLRGPDHQASQKSLEHDASDGGLLDNETEFALRTDRGNYIMVRHTNVCTVWGSGRPAMQ